MRIRKIRLAVVCLMVLAASTEIFTQTRIKFAPGRTSASISGTLGRGGQRSYVLAARYGQYLSGNVSSRTGCVKFTEGSTSVGFTTRAGDNYVSITNYCSRPTNFILTVSINYGSD